MSRRCWAVVRRLVGEGRDWPDAEPGLCWRSRKIGRGGKIKAAGQVGLVLGEKEDW